MSPHAERDTDFETNGTMGDSTSLTNGETPSSKVLSHLHSYPVIHDSLETLKSHPYGTKSLSLTHSLYTRFIAPLHPYLATPYSYMHPYLTRADDFGDSTLDRIDQRFPIVKEDTPTLKKYASSPYTYLRGTYEDEYQKTKGGDGVVKVGLAVVSTELKVAQDAWGVVVGYLKRGKEVGSKKVEEVKQ